MDRSDSHRENQLSGFKRYKFRSVWRPVKDGEKRSCATERGKSTGGALWEKKKSYKAINLCHCNWKTWERGGRRESPEGGRQVGRGKKEKLSFERQKGLKKRKLVVNQVGGTETGVGQAKKGGGKGKGHRTHGGSGENTKMYTIRLGGT